MLHYDQIVGLALHVGSGSLVGDAGARMSPACRDPRDAGVAANGVGTIKSCRAMALARGGAAVPAAGAGGPSQGESPVVSTSTAMPRGDGVGGRGRGACASWKCPGGTRFDGFAKNRSAANSKPRLPERIC